MMSSGDNTDRIVVCATGVTFGEEAFAGLGAVHVRDARSMTPDDVADAELLIVRSTTPVNAALLDGSRVRFVGTATIGIDHFDTDYFDREGITWTHAPGCNAVSVSEYITSSLLMLNMIHGVPLQGRTMGVIGVGQVGRRVVHKARALGLRVLMSDPPLERAGECPESVCGHSEAEFVPLEMLLAESDVVTLHVPLTRDGEDATFGMVDDRFCQMLKPGCVFMNSARGPVMQSDAVIRALERGQIGHAVIDTWEGEPGFSSELMARAAIGTPHIAGYSFDGKVRGTEMIYRDACRHLGVAPVWKPDALLPEPELPAVTLPAGDAHAALWEAVRRVYDVRDDDARLREALEADADVRSRHFDALRKQYPVRREFAFTHAQTDDAELRARCAGLGFRS